MKPVVDTRVSRGRQDVGVVLRSAGWLTGDQLVRMIVGFLVGVAIARHLGPSEYGHYSYVLSLLAIAGALSPIAADPIIARELLADPEGRNRILGSQALLRLYGGALASACVILAVALVPPRAPELLPLAALSAVTLMMQPFEAIPVWFQTQMKPGPSVIAKLVAFLIASAARVGLVLAHAPLVSFFVVMATEAVLSVLALLAVYRSTGQHIREWEISRDRVLGLLRDSWPLVLSGASSILYLRLDLVMLNAMREPHEVGIYGAATRLSELWYFLPMALTASMQPVLLRTRLADPQLFTERLKVLYASLAWTSILVALAVTLTTTPIVVAVFGEQYRAASPVLLIHIWAAVAVFLGVASSQFLVAENLGRISMYRTTLGLAVNVALNVLLIPTHGAVGAAIATVVSYFVATFSLVFFDQTRSQAWLMLRALSPAGARDLTRFVSGRLRHSRSIDDS
jgi:PST family polysaccharide transporter